MTPATGHFPELSHAKGELAQVVRQFDWAHTSLGPIERWPLSLRNAVAICLGSRFPMFVWWGRDLINIHNDAYAPILGRRAGNALGKSARELWSEIWDVVGPQVDTVLQRGESTWNDRVPLVIERNGYSEDTWFTWSYSPIADETGAIVGLICVCTEETARVLAERERDRLAAQRQLALDAASLGWWHYDPQTHLATWDKRYREIFDVKGDARPNDEILERIHPEDRPGVLDAVRAALDPEHPKPYVTEYRVRHEDGSWHWVEARGLAQFEDRQGVRTATSFVGTVNDITDRRTSTDRAKVILENITDGFLSVDRNWRFNYVNAQAEAILAKSRSELVGRILWEQYPSLSGSAFERAYRQAAEERRPATAIAFYPDHDRWYEVHAYPAEDGGISIYFRDISERKQSEAAIQESEQRLRLALSIAQMGTFEVDMDTDDITLNEDARAIYDLPPNEPVTSEQLQDQFHPEDRLMVLQAFADSFDSEGDGEIELVHRIIRPDQSIRWLRVRGRTLFEWDNSDPANPTRQARRCAGTFIDITEQKESERQKEHLLAAERHARSEAERASRMKDEFLATLSHELRTPLSAIVGWSQILSRGLMTKPEEVRHGIEIIQRNARAQAQIIEDLLDMSRIISGKVKLEVRRLDLTGVVEAAVETVQHAAQSKGIAIETHFDPSTPMVNGDANRLQQVVWNLVSNAIKFTPTGGRVAVDVKPQESSVIVSVSDSGEGIRADFLPHVFERFRQADASTTRKHGGLGLGLSIAKHIVELHGGSIGVTSEGEGKGATFTLTLPIAPRTALPTTFGSTTGTSVGRSVSGMLSAIALSNRVLDGLRIVAVDDEPDARELVKRLLEDAGAQVQLAGSAVEAFNLIRQEPPDVLVSDIGMPGDDGYALVRRIRQLPAHEGGRLAAVALTAYARSEDRMKAIQAGFQTHLVKPVDAAELISVIANIAGQGKSSSSSR